jgi:hypothetical protein
VFASASNFRFVSGRLTVGAAVLAIRARLATAALVGTFFWLALFHIPLLSVASGALGGYRLGTKHSERSYHGH